MSKNKGRPLSFDLVSDGLTQTTVARYKCARCPATKEIRVKSGEAISPQGFAKRMEQIGWKAHSMRAADVLCPACARSNGENDPESELKRFQQKMSNATTAQPTPAPATVTLIRAPLTEPEKPLTSDQRVAIRAKLDEFFDDRIGCYIDGMTDQRIGQMCEVAWKHVSNIREAAYGPIRVDPVIVGFQAEVTQLRREVAKLQADLKTAYDSQFNALTAQTGKLTNLADRLNKSLTSKGC